MKTKACPTVARRTLLVVCFLLLIAPDALAFPVAVEVVGKVQLGTQPKLIFQALEAAQNATVKLKREDGRSFTFPLGNLSQNQTKEVELDGTLGRHSYEGAMTALVGGEQLSSDLSFQTVVAAPIVLTVAREQLNLDAKTLVFSASVQLARAQLSIFGVDGHTIFDEEFALPDAPAGKAFTLRWKGGTATEVARIELRVTDSDGFFKGVALTPWSVTIPHEEVLFASNSADIELTEEGKLRASLDELRSTLERFEQIKGVQLFIAGHTDTVGKPAHNANLSRRRAQAIGQWFVQQGVPIPVYFEGFGESSPKVKTGDEVDEPKNRRVDYILSVEAPLFKSSAHSWKRLK